MDNIVLTQAKTTAKKLQTTHLYHGDGNTGTAERHSVVLEEISKGVDTTCFVRFRDSYVQAGDIGLLSLRAYYAVEDAVRGAAAGNGGVAMSGFVGCPIICAYCTAAFKLEGCGENKMKSLYFRICK